MKKALLIAMLSVFSLALRAQTASDSKLTGQIIYGPENPAPERSASYAFDGNCTTSYKAAYKYEDRNDSWYWNHSKLQNQHHAWVGYDFGEGQKRIITQVKWVNCAGPDADNVLVDMGWNYGWYHTFKLPFSCTAVFEGANQPDFSDAVPLYLVTDDSNTQSQHSADVHVSRAFRYVRYMGPVGSMGRIAELEFYGHEGEGDDTQFYQPSNLPVVVVHTVATDLVRSNGTTVHFDAGTNPPEDHEVNPDDYERNAVFTFLSKEGVKIFTSNGTFRERGNSSRYYGKRPYRIKLSEKSKVFASKASAKKWALVPAIDDKSLMRNIIGYNISERLGAEYAPYCRPVDLFVNGEYRGQYQFCDQVDVNKNRVNIEEIKPTTKDADGNPTAWPADAMNDFGWFTEIDAQVDEGSENTFFKAETPWEQYNIVSGNPVRMTHIPVTIKSPDEDENLASYKPAMASLYESLFSTVNQGKADEYLDLTSFARHFLAVEFVGNTDGYRSIYQYKHKGDNHLFTGPLWDLNLTLNNDYRIGDLNQCTEWSFNEKLKRGEEHWVNAGTVRPFLQTLFANNPRLMKEVKDVWASVRQTGAIDREALLAEVDALKTKLQISQAYNYMRWNILGYRCFYEPERNEIEGALPGTWEGEVALLRNCISGRVDWMDNQVWKGSPKTASKQITITDARWATIYLPHAFAVPEGLTCYAVTGVDDAEGEVQKLKLKAVTNTEANKPYLLYGEPGTYTLAGYAGGYIDDASRGERSLGLLTGVAVQRAATVGTYVLQNHNGRVCFYRVYEDSHSTVKPERAYLTLPATASNAPVRFYLDDEENALDEIAQTEDNVQIFNLSGKLLNEIPENKVSETLRQYGRGIYVIRSGSESHKVTIRE